MGTALAGAVAHFRHAHYRRGHRVMAYRSPLPLGPTEYTAPFAGPLSSQAGPRYPGKLVSFARHLDGVFLEAGADSHEPALLAMGDDPIVNPQVVACHAIRRKASLEPPTHAAAVQSQ